MSFGTLYSRIDIPRTVAVLIAAKCSDLELDVVETFPNAEATFNLSEAYRRINPLGKTPSFVGADGYSLTEVIAIAIYFVSQNEKTTFLGETKQDYASILRWMSFANTELLPPFGFWFRPILGITPYNEEEFKTNSKLALQTIEVLEIYLTQNTYLVGERVTLADLFTAALLTRPFATVLGEKWRSGHPAVTRWYKTIAARPEFKAVVPNPVLVTEEAKYKPR